MAERVTAQMRRAVAAVGRQDRRDLGYRELIDSGLDHHFARKLHSCCLEIEAENGAAIEAAKPTMKIAARAVEKEPPGTLDQLEASGPFSAVLYLDVLEHITEDQKELAKAANRLMAGGSLIVLAPAHQFLFSAFDRAIGHYRRYSASSLRALAPPGCHLAAWRMLDSAGFFASLTNRLSLGSATPSTRQVAFWDKVLVPASRRLDPLFGYHFGKSILARWTATQLPFPTATTVRQNRAAME
jgi:hypothetical protein